MVVLPSSSHYKLPGSRLFRTSSPLNAGTLMVIDENGTPTSKKRKISTSHEIVIGRDPNKCHWAFDDPSMSHKHLRVYVIVFEHDDVDGEALVYAEDLSRNGCHWNGSSMGKKNDAFLLSDSDRLRLTSKTKLVFQAHSANEKSPFDVVQEREMQSFCNKYVLTDRLLGLGAFGSVFMAIEQTSRTQLACKVVDLRRIGRTREQSRHGQEPPLTSYSRAKSELRKFRIWADKQKRQIPLERKFNSYMREFEILSTISHPNIVALDKVFVTDNNIYVFQDLMTSGDLFSYIDSKNHKLLEVEAAVIIRQVLIAVQYLHGRNIAHRDLEPENVMLTSLVTGARVMLTNFGSARHILPMQRATTLVRTEEYGALELIDQQSKFFSKGKKLPGYTLAVDMWSVGIISILLLAGFRSSDNPDGSHHSTLALRAELGRLEEDIHWRSLGEQPKKFVRRLLVLKEDERLTAEEALKHSWFSNEMRETDFEEVYKRTIKNCRPRIPNIPLVEFIQGQCREVRYFESSQKFLEEHKSARGRSLLPAEPPYKPFYRKVYDQTGLWPPKRKRGYGMSDEQKMAVERWNETMSEPSSPNRAMQQSPDKHFKKPEMPVSVPTSPSRKRLALTAQRLSPLVSKSVSEAVLERPRSTHGTTVVRNLAEQSLAANKANDSCKISLPLRPSLVQTPSFCDAAPCGLLAATMASKMTAINAPRTHPEADNEDGSKLSTPTASPTWLLGVKSRSKLRSRTLSADRSANTPAKRQGRSVFDIEDEKENNVDVRQEIPREAMDSVLLAALKETMVSPHGAHLRLASD